MGKDQPLIKLKTINGITSLTMIVMGIIIPIYSIYLYLKDGANFDLIISFTFVIALILSIYNYMEENIIIFSDYLILRGKVKGKFFPMPIRIPFTQITKIIIKTSHRGLFSKETQMALYTKDYNEYLFAVPHSKKLPDKLLQWKANGLLNEFVPIIENIHEDESSIEIGIYLVLFFILLFTFITMLISYKYNNYIYAIIGSIISFIILMYYARKKAKSNG